MAFAYTNSAKKIRVGNPVAKAILLLLADMADADGFCYPSEKTIAETLELGESTVRKWLKYLADKNYIRKSKLSGELWKHNAYKMVFSPVEQELSPLPDSDEEGLSPLPDSDEQAPSPLPRSIITATTYHRYDVAPNHHNKESFKPPEESEREPSAPTETLTNGKKTGSLSGLNRLSETYQPSAELLEWAQARAPGVNVEEETESFVLRFTALPDTDEKAFSENWDNIWKLWILRNKKFLEGKNGTNQNNFANGNKPTPASVIAGRPYRQTNSR